MREMKDSGVRWIGEIPTKWTIAKAKNCVEIQNGSDPKTEGSIPVYGSGSMSFKTCGEYKEGPSVLIGRKGATLHIPHYISSKFWNVDTAFNVYSKSIFDLKYYFYCAHVFDYTFYMSQATLPSMTQTAYENMFLPLPTKEEQYAIANQLDQICSKIDAVLEKTRASIEEYKKLKQTVITQVVTKGVRGDRPMKDSSIEWIGEIPAGVPISRVGLHFDIVLGKMLCSAPVDDNYTLESYYCAADVHFEGLSNGEKKKMWFSPDEKEQYCVKNGDLLVVEGGAGAGGCAIAVSTDVPIYIQNSIMIVRSKGISNIRYLRYLLECLVKKGYIDVVCNKATIPHFTKDKLANVPFIVFSQSEQEEIAEYLNEKCAGIDALIVKRQQYLTEIENYKKSLIYEYVTGKKEVKTSVLAD